MLRPLLLLLAALPTSVLAGETLFVAPDLYAPQSIARVDPAAAKQLLEQARESADAGRVSQALQLATQALQRDPDEPTCRHVLGYERVGDEWLTPFQAKQIRRGFVWHSDYGWLKSEDLPRYEAGERPDGRRWVSVTEDAAEHATIDTGWQVRTDHFQVTTNHSLEAAASLAAELEGLFQVWRQLFAGYYLGDAEVRGRFAGTRRARVPSKPMNVIYHRDKRGYVAALRHKQPRIGETLGIYFDDLREAHFFAGNDGEDALQRATLYHEAVHQLFQESRRNNTGAGSEHNFWAVEGVATYFESLTPTGSGSFSIGAADAGRLPTARRRLLDEGYLMPLEEMALLGMRDLQQQGDLPALYSQMAAVATFLMHSEKGRRREPFVEYLRDLYAGRAREDSLWRALNEATGETPAEVQAAYGRWLTRLPE